MCGVISGAAPRHAYLPSAPADYEADDLEIIEPTEDPALWGRTDLPPLELSRDIVDYLLEVREDRDFGPWGSDDAEQDE